ncbi:trinucleotide repeat-containing gene 6B protein [Grus japonensis]|uniref:Trinucleotide repeat-containing gene 6B protein n=1 Tax=Grus japonensis TaxID=30415 RepID=A0ABC9VUJ1_GRUJA
MASRAVRLTSSLPNSSYRAGVPGGAEQRVNVVGDGFRFCTECSQDRSLWALAALGNCQRQYFAFLQNFAQILFPCKLMREKYWRKAVPRSMRAKMGYSCETYLPIVKTAKIQENQLGLCDGNNIEMLNLDADEKRKENSE